MRKLIAAIAILGALASPALAQGKKVIVGEIKKRAEAQKAIHETMSGLKDTSAFETFDRMAAKIDQLEAEGLLRRPRESGGTLGSLVCRRPPVADADAIVRGARDDRE